METISRSAFINRYLDLYRTARFLNGLGKTTKAVGLIFGLIICVFWFLIGAASAQMPRQTSPFGPNPGDAGLIAAFVCIVVGAVAGALIFGLFFLAGVLISAQGQLLKAQADGAVHTSPFLSDEEKATAMSLPYTRRVQEPFQSAAV